MSFSSKLLTAEDIERCGVSGKGGTMVVEVIREGSEYKLISHSIDDIVSAIENGIIPVLRYGTDFYYITQIYTDYVMFSKVGNTSDSLIWSAFIIHSDSSVTNDDYTIYSGGK